MWYGANIIMWVRFKDGCQSKYPIWENVVLIEAGSEQEAFLKAERRGSEDAGDAQGSFLWEERPAEWIYGGVRKILKCGNSIPKDGTEISFSQMEVDSKDALNKLINGDAVNIYYEEEFQEEEL